MKLYVIVLQAHCEYSEHVSDVKTFVPRKILS